MKTSEELKILRDEYEKLVKKLNDLTDEELEQVSSGIETYPKEREHDRSAKVTFD